MLTSYRPSYTSAAAVALRSTSRSASAVDRLGTRPSRRDGVHRCRARRRAAAAPDAPASASARAQAERPPVVQAHLEAVGEGDQRGRVVGEPAVAAAGDDDVLAELASSCRQPSPCSRPSHVRVHRHRAHGHGRRTRSTTSPVSAEKPQVRSRGAERAGHPVHPRPPRATASRGRRCARRRRAHVRQPAGHQPAEAPADDRDRGARGGRGSRRTARAARRGSSSVNPWLSPRVHRWVWKPRLPQVRPQAAHVESLVMNPGSTRTGWPSPRSPSGRAWRTACHAAISSQAPPEIGDREPPGGEGEECTALSAGLRDAASSTSVWVRSMTTTSSPGVATTRLRVYAVSTRSFPRTRVTPVAPRPIESDDGRDGPGSEVRAGHEVGDAGRLGLTLDLDGHAGDQLHPAVADVGGVHERRARPHPRARSGPPFGKRTRSSP